MNFLLYLTGISKLCFHLAYKFLGTGRKTGTLHEDFMVGICIHKGVAFSSRNPCI